MGPASRPRARLPFRHCRLRSGAAAGHGRAREPRGDVRRDVLRCPGISADGNPGKLLIDRQPLVKQGPQLRPRVPEQQRPGFVQPYSLSRLGEAGLQVHHRLAAQQSPGAWIENGAAAEAEHPAVVRERAGHGGALKPAEHRLAVLDEDVADRLARDGLHVAVRIGETDSEQGGEQRPDRGLSRAGRTDENHRGPRHVITSASR